VEYPKKKMEGMTLERLTNWGKGWCDTHNLDSIFYNKEDGYNKEQFEEDNNRINNIPSSKRQVPLLPNSLSVSSSSPSTSSSTSSSFVSSDEPSEEELAFYTNLTE
jgi:hypothetical protein